MSERMDDDELRAMLTARADRVSPGAARKVLAAVRDAGRGPAGGTGFALLPIAGSGRRGVAPAGWAVAALVAVIAIAVLGGRLERAPAASVAASDAGATAAAPTGSAEPSASGLPEIAGQLSVNRLLLGIADRSLDGRIVLVQGELQSVAWPCPSGTTEPCTRLFIPGLDGIAVTWDGGLLAFPISADPRSGSLTVNGTLVVVPRDGRLALLGRLTGDLEHPSSLPDLLYQRRLLPFDDPLALTAVAGWLVVGGIHSCPFLGPGATPCPGSGPLLSDKEPFPDGMMTSEVQAPVAIGSSAVGIVEGQVVTPGPFLYRVAGAAACNDVASSCPFSWAWLVVARYDANQVMRVSIP